MYKDKKGKDMTRTSILALDDSESALKLLVKSIHEAHPFADVFAFSRVSELIEFAKNNKVDIAFLDIKVWGQSGITVAKELKDIMPQINIIFVTAYSDYMLDAFALHASGYVLKPVTKEAIQRELTNLRHPIQKKYTKKVFIQTFGNFEVFLNGEPLVFPHAKTKEALAFLVDRKGASVRASEIAAVLWEDKEYNRYLQNQIQKVISYMMQVLRDNGIGDIVIKKRNNISIDREQIDCDYYDFLKGEASAINTYCGEYMANYSWAEMTTGALSQKISIN